MVYELDKPLPKLSDVRRTERNEIAYKFSRECKALLQEAIEYYRINYPNSIKGHTWNKEKVALGIGTKTLEEELDKMKEYELQNFYPIFEYYHAEGQMNRIIEHRKRDYILSLVRKRIPGGTFYEKLQGLYKKRKNVQKKIDELEAQLEKEREEFNIQIKKIKLPDKPICPVCNKVCGNMGALSRHLTTHEK